MIKVGIIGGSGLENIDGIEYEGEQVLNTPYGEPSSPYKIYRLENCIFYIISRHGLKHDIPPHCVNYRANIYGFKSLGVTRIVAFSAVGSLNASYGAGSLLLADNAIDFTNGRENTFYDKNRCVHIDLTYPFCFELREAIKQSAAEENIKLADGGVYLCTNGPRFETAAEIKLFASFGADVVGMTMFPEVALAREAEICYASVNIVTNLAAGIETEKKLTMDEVAENGTMAAENVCKIISAMPKFLQKDRYCLCSEALKGSVADK